MDEKIRQKLRENKIREMKNPTILMNENDFEILKKEVESKTTIVVGNNSHYEGVPIKTNNIIQSGNIVVYDDALIPDVSNAVCGMPNCQKKVHRLGYCQKHYKLYMMFPAY